ncbi:N-acetylmuramoyl-L-alanine amidase [bacterium]|nr:N-acetylmuramoyl-L-alanine amidase [bacterium]
MTPEQKELLYTGRWMVTDRFDAPKTRADLLLIFNKLIDGDEAPTTKPTPAEPFSIIPLEPGPRFPIIGRPMFVDQIRPYIRYSSPAWAKGVTIHHTAAPSLAQRPDGFLEPHMRNLRSYYMGQGWSAGPHFFVDEDQAWAFSPVARPGVHARAFNSTHIGIEMLGDFDREYPWSGRGREVLEMTLSVVREILAETGWPVSAVNFHRDDPQTDKTCPGKLIDKVNFLKLLEG